MQISISNVLSPVFVTVVAWFLIKRLVVWITTRRKAVKALKDVGCAKRHWLLGHLKEDRPDGAGLNYRLNLMKRYPKMCQRWYGPFLMMLGTHHFDLTRPLLSSGVPKYETFYRFLRPWIGDGLITSSGGKWRRIRRLLTPAFHFEGLKGHLKCINKATDEMLDKWRPTSDEFAVSVEMFEDVSHMTLDNLLRCIFSDDSGMRSSRNKEYLNAVKCISDAVIHRLYNFRYQFDFIFYLSETGRKFRRALKVTRDYSENQIRKRREKMKEDNCTPARMDFLDMLLRARDENGVGLTYQEICDEISTFVFAGHDTVSSGLSWAFYNLARYPDIQEKCRKEVTETLHGRKIVEWGDLTNFSYLTMFIKESLRLYPPAFAVLRKLDKPLFFPRGFGSDQFNCSSTPTRDSSRTVPKDQPFGINIFLLHRNPAIWENPDVFDPERFTKANMEKRSSYAYLPFSAGSRNCIGQNFAINAMKTVLALALSRYRFKVDDSFPEPELQPHVILRSKTGIHIKVEEA